jgi:D-alanyl-D-alanine carboxypeptidase (penicillin-binding protein 5/6)
LTLPASNRIFVSDSNSQDAFGAFMLHQALRRMGLLGRALLALALAAAPAPFAALKAGAPGAEQQQQTRAKQAILMDAATGAVLYQHNADELAPPASMSKLMTLAVVFRALKNGEVNLADAVLMSEYAWRKGGAPSGTSAMMVPVNTRETLEDMLKGIAVQSGNDACIAIAEHVAGSEDAFAQRMTEEARRIGLAKSTFRNATGLHHPDHLMTARELALLARHIITEYPDRYAMFALKDFQYRKHRFINRNPLLFQLAGVDGLKTGYIKEAGYGMVGSAVQDGRRLIVVVNGLATADDRKEEARKLLEWGFKSFAEFKLFDAGEVVGYARVWGGNRMYVPLAGTSALEVLLPRTPANQRLRAEIVYTGPLKAPISKGDAVAVLRVTSSTSAASELPLYAAEDVPQAGLMRRGLDSLVHMAFGWVAL